MRTRASWLSVCFILLSISFFPRQALAWVETAVRSHQARVEVSPDGQAIVRHQLVLKVRGGPMKSLEIGGMGTAIEALPDALVRRAVEGSSSQWPLTISSLEDGSLRLKIGAERGIRGGSYLFEFAYSLDLNEMGWLNASEDGVVVTWVGPRLTSGVDSAKVTFVVPHGEFAPRLAPSESSGGANVLLGEVRRGASKDEIDLVRAHLATGEPALWRTEVSASAFPTAPALASAASASPILKGKGKTSPGLSSQKTEALNWALCAGVAFIYALLLFFKARLGRAAAALTDARVKPLVPGSPLFRAGLAFGLVVSSCWMAVDHRPWPAVALGMVAVCLSTFLLPVRVTRPRGPGTWEQVQSSALLKAPKLPGSIFELRSWSGFALFMALTLAIVASAYRLLPLSNYFSLMVATLILLLVPLFWTGKTSDLPQAPLEQAKPWLSYLERAIDSDVAGVELWGRRAVSGAEPSAASFDEARIRLVLKDCPSGLRALELSLDEAAGACVLPCVVVRALEDSVALAALPGDLPWQRGRSSEERVALLRPSAPTRAQVARLLRSLMGSLRAAHLSSRTNVARSSAKAEVAESGANPAGLAAI